MNIICELYGHKTLENCYCGVEYMKVEGGVTDGIGRVHADLWAECPRCGETYRAGKIHVPPTKDKVELKEVKDCISDVIQLCDGKLEDANEALGVETGNVKFDCGFDLALKMSINFVEKIKNNLQELVQGK